MPAYKTFGFWARVVFTILGLVLASGYVDEAGWVGQIIGAIMAAMINAGWVSRSVKRALIGMVLGCVLGASLTGCSTSDLFGTSEGYDIIKEVASAAGDICTLLSAESTANMTNAEVLVAIAAKVPSEYQVYFALLTSIISVAESLDAKQAEAQYQAYLTLHPEDTEETKSLMKANFYKAAQTKVSTQTLNALKQEARSIRKAHTSIFSKR